MTCPLLVGGVPKNDRIGWKKCISESQCNPNSKMGYGGVCVSVCVCVWCTGGGTKLKETNTAGKNF